MYFNMAKTHVLLNKLRGAANIDNRQKLIRINKTRETRFYEPSSKTVPQYEYQHVERESYTVFIALNTARRTLSHPFTLARAGSCRRCLDR